MESKFVPKALDYDLSPYTGLTRESWLEAGMYMLEGIFQNIDDMEKPVVVPRKETEITYPHLKASEEVQKTQRTAEVFEGLTRSFFIAAPVMRNIPDLEICGYSMADYYKNHVLRGCTKGDPLYACGSLQTFPADRGDLCAGNLPLDQQRTDMGYLYKSGKGYHCGIFTELCP